MYWLYILIKFSEHIMGQALIKPTPIFFLLIYTLPNLSKSVSSQILSFHKWRQTLLFVFVYMAYFTWYKYSSSICLISGIFHSSLLWNNKHI